MALYASKSSIMSTPTSPNQSMMMGDTTAGNTTFTKYTSHPHDAIRFGVGFSLDSFLFVDSLAPGCSADKSGSVKVGDAVIAVDGKEELTHLQAKEMILGRQGTYTTISFRRSEGANVRNFKVQLMRGSADYIFLVECLRGLEHQISDLQEENEELRSGRTQPKKESSVPANILQELQQLQAENRMMSSMHQEEVKRWVKQDVESADRIKELEIYEAENIKLVAKHEEDVQRLIAASKCTPDVKQLMDENAVLKSNVKELKDVNTMLKNDLKFYDKLGPTFTELQANSAKLKEENAVLKRRIEVFLNQPLQVQKENERLKEQESMLLNEIAELKARLKDPSAKKIPEKNPKIITSTHFPVDGHEVNFVLPETQIEVQTMIPNDFFEDDVPICEFEDDASPQVGRKEKAKVQRSAAKVQRSAAPAAKKAEAAPEAKTEADAPFTLALDMDFNSIGDHTAFKHDVAHDIAAAAKIDTKHIKITGLRAGSVIVDMLIAKEAGDVKAIVQDLEKQVKSPNSLLRQGKLTSKTKEGISAIDNHVTGKPVTVALKLDMHLRQAGDQDMFKMDVTMDVCAALGPDVKRVDVLTVRAGTSVIVDLKITAAAKISGENLISRLIQQQADRNSRLMRGKYTCRTVDIRLEEVNVSLRDSRVSFDDEVDARDYLPRVPAPYYASTPISPGFYSSPVHPTYPMSASRSPGGYSMSMSNLSLSSLAGYYPSSPSGSRRGYPVM